MWLAIKHAAIVAESRVVLVVWFRACPHSVLVLLAVAPGSDWCKPAQSSHHPQYRLLRSTPVAYSGSQSLDGNAQAADVVKEQEEREKTADGASLESKVRAPLSHVVLVHGRRVVCHACHACNGLSLRLIPVLLRSGRVCTEVAVGRRRGRVLDAAGGCVESVVKIVEICSWAQAVCGELLAREMEVQ